MRKIGLFTIIALCLTLLAAPRAGALQPLKLGIHPYLSATELVRRFKPLADYLGRQLKVPVTIEIASSYKNHIQNVETGVVDIAFMGPASYVSLDEAAGPWPILAAFQANGKKTFRGVIVARRESPLTDLVGLRGKRFAFGDRQSTMSHLVARHMLLAKGIAVGDFADYQFLTNHENIALGVLGGDFDAGALMETIFRKYEPEGLKAIAFSPEIGDHVFVKGARISAVTANSVQQALLGLKDRPEGKEILAGIRVDLGALVPAEGHEYDNLRAILKDLKAAGVEL